MDLKNNFDVSYDFIVRTLKSYDKETSVRIILLNPDITYEVQVSNHGKFGLYYTYLFYCETVYGQAFLNCKTLNMRV